MSGVVGKRSDLGLCSAEADKARRVVQLIRDQPGLHVFGVCAGLEILQTLGESLQSELKGLRASKGTHEPS
jgi:hypothetical protein